MGGSRNLVIFLGIALVIVRFLTSSQRSALAGLWNAGGTASTYKSPMQNTTGYKGGTTTVPGLSVARGGRG